MNGCGVGDQSLADAVLEVRERPFQTSARRSEPLAQVRPVRARFPFMTRFICIL